jgi:hypothetical protein
MRRRDGETTSPLQKTNMLHLTSRRLRRIIAYASAEATSGSISTWLSREPISPAEEQSVDAPGSLEFLVPRLLATEAASGVDADDPTAPSMPELLRRLQRGDAFSRKVIRNSQSPKGQRHNLDAGWRVDQKRLVRKVDRRRHLRSSRPRCETRITPDMAGTSASRRQLLLCDGGIAGRR